MCVCVCLVHGILIIINIYKLLHIFTNYFSLFFHTHTHTHVIWVKFFDCNLCYMQKWFEKLMMEWKWVKFVHTNVRVCSTRKAKTMQNKIAWCWFLYFKRICSLQNVWWNGVYLHTCRETGKPYLERTVTATIFRFSDISIKYYIHIQ